MGLGLKTRGYWGDSRVWQIYLSLTPYRIWRPFTFESAQINVRQTPREKTCASGL